MFDQIRRRNDRLENLGALLVALLILAALLALPLASLDFDRVTPGRVPGTPGVLARTGAASELVSSEQCPSCESFDETIIVRMPAESSADVPSIRAL